MLVSKNTHFSFCLCCVSRTIHRMSQYLLLMPMCKNLPALSFIDKFGAVRSEATNLSSKWIFKLTPPAPPHSQAERLSTLKTDRPSLFYTPRPDIQFISWETCRRSRGGGAFSPVSLQQPLLSMLYLGSFHPPAHSGVYTGPSLKDPRLSHPEFLHLKGKSVWQEQQDSDLWCSPACARDVAAAVSSALL